MTTDKRKTVEEQLYGVRETVNMQNLSEFLGTKQQAPKCPSSASHRHLKYGESCTSCSFTPNKI